VIQVTAIPTEHVIEIWPRVREFITDVCAHTHGRYEPEDVLDELCAGVSHLWVAFEDKNILGAVVTNIMNYPRKRVLNCPFVTGDDFKSWKDPMLALLRRFAADHGCACLESTARLGWARVFKDDGYEALWQTFELPLGEEK
jgi:hypothetical protein